MNVSSEGRTILISKVVNDFCGYIGSLASFITRSDTSISSPVSVAIEPTNICNLHCTLCAAGAGELNRPSGSMTMQQFIHILDTLPKSVSTLYLWGQGEPFLAPDFLEMISYAASKQKQTIVSTNGHFLNDISTLLSSGLTTLIVSLDGIDASTYQSYRVGGNFEKVTQGIREIANAKKQTGLGPEIVIQFLVTRENESSIEQVKAFAKQLGADRVVFKTLQAAWLAGGESLVPTDLKLSRYHRAENNTLVADRYRLLQNRCFRLYYSLQIDWQGNVLPCCFDKDSQYILGNIFNTDFHDLWNGDSYRNFRHTLNHSGRVYPMCNDCSEGVKRMEFNG